MAQGLSASTKPALKALQSVPVLHGPHNAVNGITAPAQHPFSDFCPPRHQGIPMAKVICVRPAQTTYFTSPPWASPLHASCTRGIPPVHGHKKAPKRGLSLSTI